MAQKSHTLSKSRFTRGLQCHKSLWLATHKPELREESESTMNAFAQGHKVGDLARDLFPGGVLVPFDDFTFDEQLQLTQKAVASAKVIYEAAFVHNGVLVKADILRKVRGGWELYEVKGSSRVKDNYLDDTAVQYHVISGSGIPLKKAYVVHLNSGYRRSGDLELNKLFTRHDVTDDVLQRQPDIKKEIARQKRMLKGDEPDISIGPWCSDPYECDFTCHCWRDVPENSVFDLAGRGVDAFKLYEQGIEELSDIPLNLLKGKQLQQLQAAKGKKTIVDKQGLQEFLGMLRYPLYFLDFETFMEGIPPYDGMKPFQQVPFQYSLHWLNEPGGTLYHTEFLAQPGCDPRGEIARRLVKDIPADACVLAYWKSFEAGRIKELAERFPLQRKRLLAIIENMVDLIAPFKARHLYSWKQNGSHSIKVVLPAFVTGMSYENMEIGDGGAAMEAYQRMCECADRPKELAQIRKNLLEYCKLDTLAMVKLFEVIERKAGKAH